LTSSSDSISLIRAFSARSSSVRPLAAHVTVDDLALLDQHDRLALQKRPQAADAEPQVGDPPLQNADRRCDDEHAGDRQVVLGHAGLDQIPDDHQQDEVERLQRGQLPPPDVPWSNADASLATGQIRLIVPILTVEELDELLHDRRGDRKRRARTVTRGLIPGHQSRFAVGIRIPRQDPVDISSGRLVEVGAAVLVSQANDTKDTGSASFPGIEAHGRRPFSA
jgi:hypothetical protein